jgi:hypothetical protein
LKGSKKGKKGGRESLVPISDDEDSNDSAQLITWSADGNKVVFRNGGFCGQLASNLLLGIGMTGIVRIIPFLV